MKDLRVERDEAYGRYRFLLTTQDGEEFSSRVLSDGTLRMLALLTYLYDPRRRSVLLFEEPENGLHYTRLARLIAVLRGACTSMRTASDEDERLFQVILNTHSLVVLRETEDEEIVVVTWSPGSIRSSRSLRAARACAPASWWTNCPSATASTG